MYPYTQLLPPIFGRQDFSVGRGGFEKNMFLSDRPGRPKGGAPQKVGPVQATVLAAIRDNPSAAHGIGIARHLRRHLDPDIADAQVYVALRRLEARGLIVKRTDTDTLGDATDPQIENRPSTGRRGRPHKLYSLTVSGRRALERVGAEISTSNPGASAKKGKDPDDRTLGTTPTPLVG